MSQGQKETNLNEFNKFLDNNTDFLEERYSEHFKNKTFKPKQVDKPTAIHYIYDVFSFSKYENDDKLNRTLKNSLDKNIGDFINIILKKKQSFNQKTAVQLLRYCIENNQMFSVKYDKKDKKIKTENNSQLMEEEKKEEEKQSEKEKEKENEEKLEESKIEEKSEEENKNEGENEVEKQNLEEEKPKIEESVDENLMNQFEMAQEEKIVDPNLIKKNLKQMFEFYCKQQQNVGAYSTFDRISYECSTMNLGKMLSFAKLTNILNDKIDRGLITRKFKLIAEGKREIQFDKFYDLMNVFASIDQSLIPKLGVDEKESFKEKLKNFSKPFNTQDTTTRQIKRDSVFVPVLTSHSGKPSDALADQIKVRKKAKTHKSVLSEMKHEPRKLISRSRYENQKFDEKDKSQIMSPKQLSNSSIKEFDENFRILEKIVSQDGDDEWLKDYKLPAPTVHKTSHLPPRLMPRKESIVNNLKKRVQELQRTETRQTVNLEKREMKGKKIFSKGLLIK